MSGLQFLAAEWPAPANIVAGTTLRCGGESHGPYSSLNLGAHAGDDPASVSGNRNQLLNTLDLPRDPAWLRQTHGANVVRAPLTVNEPEADACVSNEAGVVCAVLTADCLPALFATTDGTAVAAAHAGWRGLSSGILEATVETFTHDPDDLLVWLGPAISQPAFEVGDEVRDAFTRTDSDAAESFERNDKGRWQADLYGLARRRLSLAGVTSIFGGGRCTYREEEAFYSFRRDGQCGRMASLIFRRE